MHACWRARRPPVCYSRVNYSVVWPADKYKMRGLRAKVTFGVRLVWGQPGVLGGGGENGWRWWVEGESNMEEVDGYLALKLALNSLTPTHESDTLHCSPVVLGKRRHLIVQTNTHTQTHTHTHSCNWGLHNYTRTDGCCYKLFDNHKLLQTHADSWVCVICMSTHAHTSACCSKWRGHLHLFTSLCASAGLSNRFK